MRFTTKDKDLLVPPLYEADKLTLRHELLVIKEFTIKGAVWKPAPLPLVGVTPARYKCWLIGECETSLWVTMTICTDPQ
jgi:hypothetical protein